MTGRIEDAYPLSPMQQGMLFHSLRAKNSGVDIEQVIVRLPEETDAAALERAWQRAVERHAILRTGFRWEDGSPPLQEVRAAAALNLEQHDWRRLAITEQERRLAALLAEERARGFDVKTPPLARLALARTAHAEFHLVWTFHHLLLDARGIAVLLLEVFALYEAFRHGRDLELKPPKPYRAYIDRLQRFDRAAAESFWRERLRGFAAPTTLPAASPVCESDASATTAHEEQQLALSEELTAVLGELARRHGLTINTLLQGAWALLLSRHAGEDDVLFGAIRACRRSPVEGAESIVGLLINTVPLRVRVPPDMPAADWLKTLRSGWIALRDFEHTPLVDAQGWSEVPRGTPLFETLFNFQDPGWAAVLRAQGGAWARRDCRIVSQPGHPLAVDAYGGDQLLIKILHDPRRFDGATAKRMLGHIQTLLEGMAANPGQPLRALPMLTAAERRQLAVEWNGAPMEHPRDKCVSRLFEEQAQRAPDALAVADGSRRLTYRELNERSAALARGLRRLGVRAGVTAAVCLRRSVDMAAAWLAVLRAGGAYVPLDPDAPAERLAFMTSDAQAPVLLTEPEWRGALQSQLGACRVLCLGELQSRTHNTPPEPLPRGQRRAAHPDDLAYVIYTSGSTGMPKGVAIEHRSLVNLITWHQQAYHVTPADRATQLANPAFDASVWELWPYLTAGASVHIPDDATRLSPDKLLAWLVEQRITLTFIPTPLAEMMLDLPWPEGSVLRALLTGGDKLHRWPPQTVPCSVVNHYGPTENTVVTTWTPLPPGPDAVGDPPIGRPIANTEVLVLDRFQRQVPVGVPGELYIGGAGLARGYLNRPELTAEKFVPHPLRKEAGARLYRTGDRVRWRADGHLEFLGRFDHQVKLRGNRVEPGEIESLLDRHPAARQSAVVLREDQPGRPLLVAYVVLSAHAPVVRGAVPDGLVHDLRAFLQRKLPDYMVPAAFVTLDALPLTANGKVDRQALPAPELAADAGPVFVAPRTATEETLAGIWRDVLRVGRVGVHDGFFALGGHSLLAMQVIGRVRSAFQIEMPVNDLFERPTVAQLAARIDAVRQEAGGEAEASFPAHCGEVPLSFGQERMWFLEQLTPGKPFHNIPVLLRFQGALRPDTLQQGLRELVRRHSPLRTSFISRHGRPVAVVHPEPKLDWRITDLSALPPADREQQAGRMAREESEAPFDVTRAPLMRARLLRLAGDEHRLVLTVHHLVFDGWSLGVFYRELAALYEALSQGRPAALPELPMEYPDFARWQREWLKGELLEKHLEHWKGRLCEPLPLLNLPSDRPRPPIRSYRGSTLYFELPSALAPALASLARQQRVTLFMVLLSAFQALLHRYGGQTDFVIGTPIAGRPKPETEPLVGLFVNTLALRGDLSGDPTFADLLQRTRLAALEGYAHQDVPFERLVELTQRSRDLSHTPLFQAMFSLQTAPMRPVELPGLKLTGRMLDNGTSKFDLTLSIDHEEGRLSGTLEFNKDLFDQATAERMLGHFRVLLEGAVANPQETLSRLPLLTEAERRRLLVEWNDTRRAFPQGKCIHQLFEEQAARTPEALAVEFGDRRLSYSRLDELAGAWAARLRALGVGPDTIVGLCVERSLEMLVGLLGILKAGGAYLPLDPAYPVERLAFMLQDSRAPVLLTQRPLRGLCAKLEAQVSDLECLFLDEPAAASDAQACPAPRAARSTDLAYVLYTSGSTGKPKGVMVTHRNVVNLLDAMRETPGLEPQDVWLAVTTLCFDIAGVEMFLPLTVGARVVVANPQDVADGRRLAALMDACGATVMQATPATWRMLLAAGWKGRRSLRILCGGEAWSRDLANRLLERCAALWNLYGPTEATIWSTQYRVPAGTGPVLIGRPVANTQAYILDAHLHPAPIGVPGELHLGGEGIARGYLNRPELTAERFIRDPFSGRQGARLYKTGDLARFLPDGHIEFLGRLDHQVKLRGHRIEPGEIESALRRHPAVRECVAVAREDTPGDQRLVAYVVSASEARPPADVLRGFLAERLPDYMVPAAFVTLDALPLTPNGKVDRQALPKPDAARPQMATAYVAPRSDTEQRIAAIWRQLLGVERIGLNDTFFNLGGHSLLLVQLQSRLSAAFGRDVSVVDLFQHPTVGALAAWINQPGAERSAALHTARWAAETRPGAPSREIMA